MSAMLKDPPRLWRARVAAAGELRARRRRFATRRAVPEPATQRTPPSCPASPEAPCIRSPRQDSNPSSDARQSRWWSPSAPADRSWAFDHADSATSRFARLLGFDSRCRSASHGGRAAIRASPRLSRRRSHRCDGVKAKVCRPPMVSQGRDFLRISQHLGSRLAN